MYSVGGLQVKILSDEAAYVHLTAFLEDVFQISYSFFRCQIEKTCVKSFFVKYFQWFLSYV